MLLTVSTAAQADTDLELAALAGDLSAVQELLKSGAKVNQVDSDSVWEQTPLCNAARRGHTAVVKYLLQHGAAPDQKNAADQFPLMLAAQKNHAETVQVLLAYGAEIELTQDDGSQRTPLMWAVLEGHAEVVQQLLEQGANPNVVSKNPLTNSPFTALQESRKRGYAQITDMLVKSGANH